jgi:N6-adenosine-specific RNA methylase IME4/ParB-like chromosome segregation protein Spo0J
VFSGLANNIMTERSFHPLANIFPLLDGDDFENLVADIRGHGQLEPIVIHEEMVLDGRNRYRACVAAGIEPNFVPFKGNDPLAFVISANLHRRHLDESQRAMVAAKLAQLRLGDNQHSEGLPIGRGSELLNVGERSVARARTVLDHGAPELQHAVERGAVSVAAAADVATLPQQAQAEVVARGEKEILRAASEIRARKAEVRHAENMAKLVAISQANSPLPTERKYPNLLIDPPWKFHVYDAAHDPNRSPERHYPTMTNEDICKLPIADLATPDAALFLWTTAPHLPEAFQVLAAWGFEYVTNFTWTKGTIGLGFWVRNSHEHLLIARRGTMPSPLPARRPPSVIEAEPREHSRKPDEAYVAIERMYPALPRIELFAREARPGWDVWGNQAPCPSEAAS